jgi:hypothetical protein
MTTFIRLERYFSFDAMSSIETPEIKDRYPGISGSTHGDIKDKKPARIAVGISTVGCSNTSGPSFQDNQ